MNKLYSLRFRQDLSAVEEGPVYMNKKQHMDKKRKNRRWQGSLLFLTSIFLLLFGYPTACKDEALKAQTADLFEQDTAQKTEVQSRPSESEPVHTKNEQSEPVHTKNEESELYAGHYPYYEVKIPDVLVDLQIPDTSYYGESGGETSDQKPKDGELLHNETEIEDPVDPNTVEYTPVVYTIPEGYQMIYKLPGKYALLTFDDGPSVYTEQIVDILNTYHLKGVFFFIGCHTFEHESAMCYVGDHGSIIGNHTFSHREMSAKTFNEQKDEIVNSNQTIESITGKKPIYFRPPFGNLNDDLKTILKGLGMKTVLWNKDPADWDNKTGEEIMQYIVDTKPYGGIYLLHETAETVKVLPMIIEFLLEQGVEFVTLEQ